MLLIFVFVVLSAGNIVTNIMDHSVRVARLRLRLPLQPTYVYEFKDLSTGILMTIKEQTLTLFDSICCNKIGLETKIFKINRKETNCFKNY